MSAADVYVLGLNCYDHDVSACLLRNGELVTAINKERLTRIKHDTGSYGDPIEYCLIAAGIELERVDLVVRNSFLMPVRELEQRFLSQTAEVLMTAPDRRKAIAHPLFMADPPRVVDISHHLAHAYSAFACSPFERGAVMVADGVGSYRADVTEAIPEGCDAEATARESETYYAFEGKRLRTVAKYWMKPTRGLVNDEFFMMPGLGALYSRVSSYIFGHWNRCGEVMGLAPYGRDRLAPLMALVDGELDLKDWPDALRHPFDGFGDKQWNASPHRAHWEDLAWRVQEDTERVLVGRARRLHELTGERHLAMAGGVALNCVANGKVLAESPFEDVFIQPASGDDGVALGCALYGHLEILGGERRYVMTHPYVGWDYASAPYERALGRATVKLSTSVQRPESVVEEAADLLASGAVIGWFQGGSEFGPRALGNRSILADPRKASMKDHVNERVKHRQGFRPFAPAVLAERAHEYFEGPASPFMLMAQRVRREKRDEIAAVVHVDGTARVQTVDRERNPRFHALITAFAERTGVPVLLNTSFNDRGEPIVEAPGDAVRCFLRTELDALVLDDRVLRKRALYRLIRPLVRGWLTFRQSMGKAGIRQRAAQVVLDE